MYYIGTARAGNARVWYLQYTFTIANPFIALMQMYMAWSWNMIINESVQPPVYCKNGDKL